MRFATPLCLFCFAALAQPGQEIPAGGVSLLPEDPVRALRLSLSQGGQATMEIFEVDHMPFRQAVRVTSTAVPSAVWGVQLVLTTRTPVERDDVLLLALFARGYAEAAESGEARGVAYLQESVAPNTKIGTLPIRGGAQWQHFLIPFRAGMTLPEGRHNLVVHLGYFAQRMEIGGITLLNYRRSRTLSELPRTPLGYQGMEEDAPWRAEAERRIDQLRKADLRVRVTDAEGRGLPQARVRFSMRRHAFHFGSAVTAQLLNAETADGHRYRWIVDRYFNKVVFENDLKWPNWVLSKTNTHSAFRMTWTEAALAWLAERGILVRGHFVSWGPIDSANGHGNGPLETLRERLLAHIEDLLPALGTRIYEWDTVNHISGWGTATLESLYGPGIFTEIMKRARMLAPHAQHWVNEGQILPNGARRDDYARLIQFLIDSGEPPDGIGFMGHFSEASLTGIEEMWRVMNRFASLVPNLQLTELDVDTTDESMQARYLRDVMTLAFSHPAFRGIVMWGFWEGRHWKPDAALWRRDWSLKPAGEAWLNLVTARWWTEEERTTGADGTAAIRGFQGDYEVVVTAAGGEVRLPVTLPPQGATIDVRIP